MSNEKHQAIFKEWITEHKGLVYKVVRSYCTAQDADDLFQDILTQLWISIPSFNGQARVSTWIYKVAFNTALVWQRGQKKRKRTKLSLIDIIDIPDRNHSSEDQQVIESLYKSIRQLGKIDTSVILMYLDGFSYRQMSEILGISESNVGVKLNRAKKQLAKLMKGLIDDI